MTRITPHFKRSELNSSKTLIKECPNCGKEYKTYKSINKKHCSARCSQEMVKKRTYEKYKKVCAVCKKEFLPPRPAEGGVFCSYKCRGISDRKERIDRNGYWYVFVENHPNRNKTGHVPEHHLVMEKHIGRRLMTDEVVHHMNHDKKDNRIENLQLMTDSEHKSLHMMEANEKGKVNTEKQKRDASIRMKLNNPVLGMKKDCFGKFLSKGEQNV